MLIEYLYRKSIGARGGGGGRSSQEPEATDLAGERAASRRSNVS